MPERSWMTVEQAATYCGVHVSTIPRLYDRGLLNGFRTGGTRGARRIYRDEAAARVREHSARRLDKRSRLAI